MEPLLVWAQSSDIWGVYIDPFSSPPIIGWWSPAAASSSPPQKRNHHLGHRAFIGRGLGVALIRAHLRRTAFLEKQRFRPARAKSQPPAT